MRSSTMDSTIPHTHTATTVGSSQFWTVGRFQMELSARSTSRSAKNSKHCFRPAPAVVAFGEAHRRGVRHVRNYCPQTSQLYGSKRMLLEQQRDGDGREVGLGCMRSPSRRISLKTTGDQRNRRTRREMQPAITSLVEFRLASAGASTLSFCKKSNAHDHRISYLANIMEDSSD
jgi:hypothetical protein